MHDDWQNFNPLDFYEDPGIPPPLSTTDPGGPMTHEPTIVFKDGATEEEKREARCQVALAILSNYGEPKCSTLEKIAAGFSIVMLLVVLSIPVIINAHKNASSQPAEATQTIREDQ